MNLNDALQSDLGTIMRAARRGLDWWVEEITMLVPPSIRLWSTRAMTVLRFDGSRGFEGSGQAAARTMSGKPVRNSVAVLLDQDQVLIRTVAMPAMSQADLRRMLVLNAERYFPLPSNAVLVASFTRPDIAADGARTNDLAALVLSQAVALAQALEQYGIRPCAVRISNSQGLPDPRFDFLPAMQAAGLVPKRQTGQRAWWILVAALATLNGATLIWSDSAAVERWQMMVDAQRPAVSVAQRMVARMRTSSELALRAGEQRRQHDPLAVLALTTKAIPDGAWVQRYAWDGRSLRLTGYRSRDADVAGALRRVEDFTNVKSAQTDFIAETATGQPFDIVADIGKP